MNNDKLKQKYCLDWQKVEYLQSLDVISINIGEKDIDKICLLLCLEKCHMSIEQMKYFSRLYQDQKKNRLILMNLLVRQRRQVIETIHEKQKLIDKLDYMIEEFKQED